MDHKRPTKLEELEVLDLTKEMDQTDLDLVLHRKGQRVPTPKVCQNNRIT